MLARTALIKINLSACRPARLVAQAARLATPRGSSAARAAAAIDGASLQRRRSLDFR
jgi:hypothetical protein